MRAHECTLMMTDKEYGILYKRETDWGLFKSGNGSYGSTYIQGGQLTPMVLNTHKKLSYPITVSRILKWSHPVVFDTAIEGDTITFKVMVMEEDESVFLFSKISALQFLMRPFETWRSSLYGEGAPLSNLLNAKMEERKIDHTWYVYMNHKDIADLVITNFSVEKSLDIPFPNLDGLSNEEIISLYFSTNGRNIPLPLRLPTLPC